MPLSLADFYNETRDARKIIVIDLGYLGDSIHLVPTLAELKRQYPRAQLHAASTPVGGQLLEMVPCVDRIWPLVRTPKGTPWREQWRWIQHVRRERFDVAFNFSGTDRTVFLTFLTGAPHRVAYAAGGRKHFWSGWLIRRWLPRLDRTTPLAEQRQRVLTACGMDVGPLEYPIVIPQSDQDWARTHVPAGAVHFSVNAGHALKEWPVEHWVELARRLLSENSQLILVATATASARECERLTRFIQTVKSPRVHPYPGNLTLSSLAALLARCRMHVGADSGALHLAAVLGLKTVSIFREYTGLGEWLPRGPQHRSLVASCGCVNQKVQPCAADAHPVCLAGISVDSVLKLTQELL